MWVALQLCYEVPTVKYPEVKGAATICNLSVWEPRFGGFTWGWGPGWYHQGPV